MTNGVYSEYEIREMGIKTENAEGFAAAQLEGRFRTLDFYKSLQI